jgi:hypothetical protein
MQPAKAYRLMWDLGRGYDCMAIVGALQPCDTELEVRVIHFQAGYTAGVHNRQSGTGLGPARMGLCWPQGKVVFQHAFLHKASNLHLQHILMLQFF